MSALNAIMARLDSLEQPRSEPPPRRQFTPDAQQHQFTPHTPVGPAPVAPSSAFRPTVDPAIVFNATRSTAGFDRELCVRHYKMDQPRLLADLPFKRWKTDFIAYLRLKYPALIPQLVLHQSGARIDLDAQEFVHAMLAHAVNPHTLARQAMDSIQHSQPDKGSASWHALCHRLDQQSVPLTMRLAQQLVRQQRPGETLTQFVHNMRQTYDDLNESCRLADGPVVLHEHLFSIFMLAGMSQDGNLGQAKQCIINAFDPNLAISPSQLTEHILRHAAHMDGSAVDPMTPLPGTAAFLAGAPSGRRHPPPSAGRPVTRTPLTKRVHYEFAEKCGCCGEPDHRGSDCKATDAQILKWQRYKITTLDNHYNHPKSPTAHLSEIVDDTIATVDSVVDVEEDPLSDYIVSSPLCPVALLSLQRPPPTSLSQCWVVDSACSINLSAHRTDFITFQPSTDHSTVGGVGVAIKGSGTVRIKIQLQSGSIITRDLFTLFTPALIARSSQGISILLSVSWMQKHCGCEFSFPPATDIGLLIVPTGMGVLRPSGNGLYILPLFDSSSTVEEHDTPLALVTPARSENYKYLDTGMF
jgi:hypothetical protein